MLPLHTIFHHGRVALRAPRVSDAPRLLENAVRSQDHLAPWSPAPEPGQIDVAHVRERILEQRRDFRADRHYRFCLTLGREGPIIGRVALSQVVRGVFQNAYLGYWIDVEHARKGLMTEAVRLVLDVAFRDLALHRVQAAIIPHNVASLGVARNVGFRQEGRAERYLKLAGAWQDHLLFALTADEWPARPREPSPSRARRARRPADR